MEGERPAKASHSHTDLQGHLDEPCFVKYKILFSM